MGEVSYRPLMEDFVWSYSRVSSFDSCPYGFFLKYIRGEKEEPLFYSSYGSFIHKLLELYYRGLMTKDEMLTSFLADFTSQVQGGRPAESTVQKYIIGGAEYLRGFQPFPYKMMAVEKRVNFRIGDYKFVGYIDYVGEKDGKIYIVDNKARDLKPRSKRSKPTANDKQIDEMLKQLYVYSEALRQVDGMLPDFLCFNCYRTGAFIEEPFNHEAYESAIEEIKMKIPKIMDEEDFYPNQEYYQCRFLCGLHNNCEYDIESREEYRNSR